MAGLDRLIGSSAASVLANLLVAPLPRTRCFAMKRLAWRVAGATVGPGVRIHSRARMEGTNIRIGAGTWLGGGVRLIPHVSARIEVGANCDIGPDALLVTGGHEIGDRGRRAGAGRVDPIKLGAGTWIGARAVVLGGVGIGEGTVVAAGAVLIEDVPGDCLVGGIPARVIRRL